MRRPARRALLALAALALLAAPAPATAAPPRAKAGVLTGDTTIRWRGNAGIRLSTTARGSLPPEAMSLYLTGGTYAFVALVASPPPPFCRSGGTLAHCESFVLLKVPGSDTVWYLRRPGGGHFTLSPQPPTIVSRRYDAYLFTDGDATLRLRPRGHTGRSSYVAAGRVRGLARRLPGACASGCHETPVTQVAAGGAAYDFGDQPGHLLAMAFSYTPGEVDAAPSNHPLAVRSCFYPNARYPDASAAPEDHPYGCDPLPEGSGDAAAALNDAAETTSFGTGSGQIWNIPDRRGRVYAGFYAARAWVEAANTHGHAVWFGYGIT